MTQFLFFFSSVVLRLASVCSLPSLASNHDPPASASWVPGWLVCIMILAVEQFLKYLTQRLQQQQKAVTFCTLQKEAPISFRSICFCCTQRWNTWCSAGQGRRRRMTDSECLCLGACGPQQNSAQAEWECQVCQSAAILGDVFAIGKVGRKQGRKEVGQERKLLIFLSDSNGWKFSIIDFWICVFVCCRPYCIFYVIETYNLGFWFGVQFLEAIFLLESMNKIYLRQVKCLPLVLNSRLGQCAWWPAAKPASL